MLRRALLLVVTAALTFSGAASAYLLGRPAGTAATTSSTTATTATTGTTATTTTTSTAPTTLVVTGHGWGHGLGMSQWGAYGYAKQGWTFDRILAHYYTGTTIGQAPVSSVRVLLLDGAKRVTLSAASVVDEAGKRWPLDRTAKLALTPAMQIVGTDPPILLGSTATFFGATVAGKPYRGTVKVAALAGKLRVVNVVGLEAYLKGVVPSEMPSSWSPEALKAQAVAARSYALANLAKSGDYDLYNDTRSQVYGGTSAESTVASAAIDATAGQVVLYQGKVISAMFSSSSGGRTASAQETTGRAIPYLVSVPDPYDVASPYHDWGPVLLDAAKVAKQLKLEAKLVDLTQTLGPSGRSQKVTMTGDDGTQVTVTGATVRAALGLRSTWFSVGWLALTPPTAPMSYGGAAAVPGLARGVTGPVALEAKPAGGAWTPVGPVSADATTGTFTTVVRPQVTTQYRLAAGTIRAALAKVAVAPLVTATIAPGSATGSIRPALPDAPVELQWSGDGTTWTTVGSSTTDAAGAFSVTGGDEGPGSLRVRVTPGHGLVAGYSKPVTT